MLTFLGDSRFFWQENIKDFATFPSSWDSALNTGIGASQLSSLWITSFFNFTASFNKLGLSWDLIQLLFWILPAILFSFLSSFFLFKKLFKFKIQYSILAGIIYTLNTYFLMILTGGQLGVCLGYSTVPLILLGFINVIEKPSLKNALIGGLALGFQVIFDPRVVYVTLVVVFLYLLFNFSKLKIIKTKFYLLLPFAIAVLLNSFWILPLILTKNSPLPIGFDNVSGFKFFSFAKLENSISLLHPNWPENIFGKVYFLRPEFLIFPIIAFFPLLFKKNRIILFFSSLALIGIFLAKGANEPLGFINEFLFQHFPGMTMFRDPTKWYILIALSYSILIPYAIREMSKYFRFAFILFILYFLYLITPVSGQIKTYQVPQEYVQLKQFLVSQKNFSRTLWIPKWQRFGYFSNNHPAIGREELLKGNAAKQISQLNQSLLQDLSVKYIVVPYDSQSEIFLQDRKYDEKSYLQTVKDVGLVPWLKRAGGFGRIAVFENMNHKDHFWSPSSELKINYKFKSPTEYDVILSNAKKDDVLVFSEGFDSNWTAQSAGIKHKVSSIKYKDRLNSFILSKEGSYALNIYYEPQKWVIFGSWISGATLLAIVGFMLFGCVGKKW